MSAVDCRRVRNPSVLQQQQRVLTEPNKTKKLRELSSAWTLLGETKSSLNELDEKLSSENLSSQRNRGREEPERHRRNKPSVSFQTSSGPSSLIEEEEKIYQQPALNSSAYLESTSHSPSVLPSSSSSSPHHSNSTAVFGTSRSKRSPPKSESITTSATTGVGRNTHHYIPRTSVATTVVRKTTSLPETTDSSLSLSKARVALLKAQLDKQKRDLESRSSSTSGVRSPSSFKPLSLSPGVSSDPTLGNTQTRPPHGSIKRKVAVAPPPRTYAGFSTSTSKPSKTAMSSSRIAKSRPATSHPPLFQHSTHHPTSRSTVAPSSWRSGRQLASQILSREVDPQPPHLSDGYSSSTSSLSPPPPRRSPTHRPVTTNLNAAKLLSDIRRVEKEVADDVSPQQSGGVTKNSEFPTSRYRPYDPDTVKLYMQHKENERKRKARENMLAQQKKELDMNIRLLELQRTQKRVLNTNLLSRKTKSEQQHERQLAGKKAASLVKERTCPTTQSHHIASSRSLSSSIHTSVPTLHRSSPPRTTLYTSVSTPRTSTSPRHQTPATRHPQPPSFRQTTSPRHQPPASFRLNTSSSPRHYASPSSRDQPPASRSPAPNTSPSSRDQPPACIHTSTSPHLQLSVSPHLQTSISPLSPRPANFSTSLTGSFTLSSSSSSLGSSSSSSSSPSPSRSLPLHALPSRALVSHTSPVHDLSPFFPASTVTEAVSSLPSTITTSTASRSHAITVVTSSHPQTVSLTPTLITSTRSTTDLQFAGHSPQTRVRLTFSSPPPQNPPSTSDQPIHVPPAPVDPSLQRLQAIKQSALLLKQKIAVEKKRLLLEKENQRRQQAGRFTLPGAENDRLLASLVKRINDKEVAATKIQAAWRGHRVRVTRSVSPEPSSTISALSPHTLSPAVTVSRLPHLLTTAAPSQVHTSPSSSQPPKIPPWEQAGGDKLSVINIFTRHQHPLSPPLPEVKVESTTPPSSIHYTGSFEDDHSTIRSSPSLSIPVDHTPSPTPTKSLSVHSPLPRDEHTPSPAETTSSEEEEQQEEVTVITPPGSSSFCSAYVPTEKKPEESSAVTVEPRYSPHSLEVQMRAHLNALDTVDEGIRQLDKLERTRDAYQMQQESLSITQLIQSQRRTHSEELEAMNTETKQELDKTQKRIDKLEQDVHDRIEADRRVREQSRENTLHHAATVFPVTLPPYISTAVQTTTEVQKPRTPSSVSNAASSSQATPKTPSSVTVAIPPVVESSISTAVSDSINAASSIDTSSATASVPATLFSPVEETYQSDFEPTTTIQEDSLEQEGTSVVDAPTTVLSPTVTSSLLSPLPFNQPLLSPHPSGGSTDSATPVPSEYERKDEEEEKNGEEADVRNRTLTAQTVSEMLTELDVENQEEEEIEEAISKTSFRELLPSESHRRMVLHGSRPSTLSVSSDSDSLLATPAASGEVTPFQGEESFYHFVTRMVQQYVREEEMRGKHQAALLQLREKALQEKTQAELKWLNMKKTHLQDKGADDQMPPLVKREKGLIQKFKHEQAEIKRLKEAHEVASRERRLLLLQQKDIARMRKHTQYYNSKISHFSQQGGHEQSPVSESSSPPSPTVPTSQQEVSEQLSRSFSSSRELLTDISVSSSLPPSPVKPSHATVFSDQIGPDSPAMKTLRQLTTIEKERKLKEREAALKQQRKAAEEVLLAQQELLKKEMQLDKEEEEIKKLIEQAAKIQRKPALSVSASLPDVATISPQTVTKDSSVEEVLEELPSSVSYSVDTFEDTPEHTPLITSTPAIAREPSSDDFLTSDGSEIELRVTRLKKVVEAKEREVRKAQREQKKRRKEVLRQQEKKLAEQLMTHDSVLETLSHNEPLDTHETTPAQVLVDNRQELAAQAYDRPKESESASEVEESMSLAPAGSPDSSLSSASTVVSLPDYLLEKSPNLQVDEKKEEEIDKEVEQQFELTEESQNEVTDESQNEVTEELEEEMEIEEELELEGDEEAEESPRVLSPLLLSPAEQEVMTSDQMVSPQQTSYTSSSFEQPTPEQPTLSHLEPSQDSPQLSLPPEDEEPDSFYVGQRVLVGNSVEGVVRYFGETGFAPGVWVGVELDEPCGKNDGSVKGHRYFSCLPLHGVYAPPHKVAALVTPSSSGMSMSVQDFYEDVITAETLSPRGGEPTEDWQQLETPADEEEKDEIAESISQEEANKVVEDFMQWESETEQMSQNLVRELSDEAFNMIHNKWKEKEREANAGPVEWEHYLDPDHDPELELVPKDDDDQASDDDHSAVEETPEQRAERTKEERADAIADSIVEQLFVSDFNLMHNLSVAHAPESPPPTPQEEPAPPPRPSTPVPPKEAAPLCFVPGSKPSVDMIAATAWNNLRNVEEATAISKTPPPELVSQLCGQPPEHCAESFVYLVYQLAVEIILDNNRQTFCQVGNLSSRLSPKSLTLTDVQKSVYQHVTAGQHPPILPPVKYLHKNSRPGGKPVDFVDSILIRELREEEPHWVDYSQEEKQVKERVADSIMDMLLTETAEIFDSIEEKSSRQS